MVMRLTSSAGTGTAVTCSPASHCQSATKKLSDYFAQRANGNPQFGYTLMGGLVLLIGNDFTHNTALATVESDDVRLKPRPINILVDAAAQNYADGYNTVYRADGTKITNLGRRAMGIPPFGTGGEVLTCGSWAEYLSWIINCDVKKEFFLMKDPPNRECQNHLVCGRGQQQVTAPAWNFDRSCAACPANTFKSTADLLGGEAANCQNARTCTAEQYVQTDVTATSDRVCAACSQCTVAAKTFQKTPCTSHKNTECRLWRSCGAGTYRKPSASPLQDATCEPCERATYMDETDHTNTQCKQVLAICQPGQYQSVEPWVDRNRQCAACQPGKYQPAQTVARDCIDVTPCAAGFGEVSAPTSTSDRVCQYLGNPSVSCPAAKGVGAMYNHEHYASLFTTDDFKLNMGSQDDFERSIMRTDGQTSVEADLKRGALVEFTFTAHAIGDADRKDTCTVAAHVLALNTTSFSSVEPVGMSLQHAALNESYDGALLRIEILGSYRKLVYGLEGTLTSGLTAQITSNLGEATYSAFLKVEGTPAASGIFAFNVTAEDTETGAKTIINTVPFRLEVVDCDHTSYDTCKNGGTCVDDGNQYDGKFACTCVGDFLPDPHTKQCTVRREPLIMPCPCDVQLAANQTQSYVPGPMSLQVAELQKTVRNAIGEVKLMMVRSDNMNDTDDYAAGTLTSVSITAEDDGGSKVECTVDVGVVRINVTVPRWQGVQKRASELSKAHFEWTGLLPAYQLKFSLHDANGVNELEFTELQERGLKAVMTSEYEEVTLFPSFSSTQLSATLMLEVIDASKFTSGRLIAFIRAQGSRVIQYTSPENCLARHSMSPAVQYDGPSDLFVKLGEGSPSAPLELWIDDCDDNTCGDGGTCNDVHPQDGVYACDCEESYMEVDGTCQLVQASTASDNAVATAGGAFGGSLALIGLGVLILLIIRRERMRKYYHIFISYRVATDQALAEALCHALQNSERELHLAKGRALRIRCFWDRQDLKDGKDWEKGFLDGLQRSCLFLPIVSEGAVKPILTVSPDDTKNDNVLLEYEMALQYKAQGRLGILPLLMGQDATCEYDFSIYGPHKFPATSSRTNPKGSVSHTMTDLLRVQGVRLWDYNMEPGQVDIDLIHRIFDVLEANVWGYTDRRRLNRQDSLVSNKVDADVDCLYLWKHWGPREDNQETSAEAALAAASTSADVALQMANGSAGDEVTISPSTATVLSNSWMIPTGFASSPVFDETDVDIDASQETPFGFAQLSRDTGQQSETDDEAPAGFAQRYLDVSPSGTKTLAAAAVSPGIIYENMSRDEAEAKLQPYLRARKRGSFLLRHKAGDTYALTVVCTCAIEHHLITTRHDGLLAVNDKLTDPACTSLEELIVVLSTPSAGGALRFALVERV